ncbi:Lrp/AsnC family transcriptional regulator [Brevibacterium daeguense]|uniref:Lrp/AsnC family transcriptional regulator n=1 Tax=Brevibacterium daeguense TaxID=909936 RepID=A0ABP8EJ06_9MICO
MVINAQHSGQPVVQLDEKSKAIIEQLQHDGRQSYSAIGQAVGLSEAAVRQRVSRLLDSGVMQIVAVTDPMQLGFARQALIGIRIDGDVVAAAEAIGEFGEVDYLVITAGSFDIIAEVICESDADLFELINDRLRRVPGVSTTETFMYLSLHKQKYNWGTR